MILFKVAYDINHSVSKPRLEIYYLSSQQFPIKKKKEKKSAGHSKC